MKRYSIFAAVLFAAVILAGVPAFAEDGEAAPACHAQINGIVGTCQFHAKDAAEDEWKAAELNQCLQAGDKIRTLEDGKLAFKYGEGIQMRLNASSTVTIAQQEKSENPDEVGLDVGELFTELDKEKEPDSNFRVVTPAGVMAVRGTKFNIAVDAEGKSKVNVLEGIVSVFNDLGEVLAEAGKATELLKGVLPLDPFDFNVEDFTKQLDQWKDAISIGKVLEAVKDEVNNKVNEVKDSVPVPKKIKGKLGF
jgi:hypothetical protein